METNVRCPVYEAVKKYALVSGGTTETYEDKFLTEQLLI